jgi:hypothetical protein
MSDKRVLVHDRIGVHGQEVAIDESSLVDIPKEYSEDLSKIGRYQDELYNYRVEIGRLTQVMSQLTYGCNLAEKNLAESKKKIIEGLKLSDGNWAIDLESKQVGRVINENNKIPRVV